MDANYFCDTMQSELTGIKARIYTMVREMERMPAEEQEKRSAEIGEMNMMIDDLTAKIDKLKSTCPADWSVERSDIETTKKQLVEKIDLWDAEHIAGGYVGG
ncbi:MAG: hypothetical protein Q7K29_06000 [Thermoleophilia bacterium]|nr:hypothetical protein [Thermoleophilia bacterium]